LLQEDVLLRKARDVIGLPIMCVQTGNQAGIAKDLLLDDNWQVEIVLLENKRWFSTPSCILWKDVIAFGEDAITILNEASIGSLNEQDQIYISLITGDRTIKGMPVVTVNGMHLGIIDDVYIDPDLGKKVIGYELTEGFISDLKEGRKWLPLPEYATLGEDAIIVPVHCHELLTDFVKIKEE
jgi:uncharacterized protein YrrD